MSQVSLGAVSRGFESHRPDQSSFVAENEDCRVVTKAMGAGEDWLMLATRYELRLGTPIFV